MIYLARYAEIALKGKNRNDFENKLVANINSLAKLSGFEIKIRQLQGRLLIECDEKIDLRKVFGLVSFSPCIRIKADLGTICSEALKFVQGRPKATTFRISAKNLTKNFSSSSSIELNTKIGAFLAEKTGFKVKLEKPDFDLGVEIIGENAFLFDKTIACFGGLPVGIEGKVLVSLSDEKSVLAGLLMMKRGCALEFASDPEVHSMISLSLLQSYAPALFSVHKIKDLSELCELAQKLNCKALVLNDTFANLKDYDADMLILRPLVIFTDEEILSELEKYKLPVKFKYS